VKIDLSVRDVDDLLTALDQSTQRDAERVQRLRDAGFDNDDERIKMLIARMYRAANLAGKLENLD
jgi:hypothetical protein